MLGGIAQDLAADGLNLDPASLDGGQQGLKLGRGRRSGDGGGENKGGHHDGRLAPPARKSTAPVEGAG